jgi:hypothetical protein
MVLGAGAILTDDLRTLTLLVLSAVTGTTILGLLTVRRWWRRAVRAAATQAQRLDWKARWVTSRQSLSLVPHLVAFACLIQEPRLVAAWFGSDLVIYRVQFLVLITSIGASVLTAVHGLIAVRLQGTHEEDMAVAGPRTGRAYGVLGCAGGGLIVLCGPIVNSLIFGGRAGLDPVLSVLLACSVLFLSGYFLASTLLLRSLRSAAIATNSTSVALLILAAILIIRPSTVGGIVVLYAASCMGLMIGAWIASLLVLANSPAGPSRVFSAYGPWLAIGCGTYVAIAWGYSLIAQLP